MIHVLGVPDEYQYMNPALIPQIGESVGAVLGFD